MEKIEKKDKMKISIIVLAVLCAVSLSVTVYFAAFYASRTGSVTLNFADGLTMRLDPLGTSDRIQFASADESAATFTYTPVSNADTSVRLDGINATINKDAWIGLKVEFWETTSGNDVDPNEGRWAPLSGDKYCQYRTGDTSWYAEMYRTETGFTYTRIVNNIFTCISNTICSHESPIQLFNHLSIWGNFQSSIRAYANLLAGRSFKFEITIKARTDSAPTFS